MTAFTESVVENVTLAWLVGLYFVVKHGPDIAPSKLLPEYRVGTTL